MIKVVDTVRYDIKPEIPLFRARTCFSPLTGVILVAVFAVSCSGATDTGGGDGSDPVSGGITSAQVQTRGPDLIRPFLRV